MMNGIEVLNTIKMYKEFPTWILFTAIMLFIIGDSLITKFELLPIIIGIICWIITIILVVVGLNINSKYSGAIRYQVTISDDVSMVEFNERYDVIDVEGKIWTIVEKEGE